MLVSAACLSQTSPIITYQRQQPARRPPVCCLFLLFLAIIYLYIRDIRRIRRWIGGRDAVSNDARHADSGRPWKRIASTVRVHRHAAGLLAVRPPPRPSVCPSACTGRAYRSTARKRRGRRNYLSDGWQKLTKKWTWRLSRAGSRLANLYVKLPAFLLRSLVGGR